MGFFQDLGRSVGLVAPKKRDTSQGTPISPDIPGFADLRQQVQGRQIGFGDQFVERATSPAVAERAAGFELRERPALEESFASRGLGRSSLAGREVGQAFAQKERDINQLIAEATLQNLIQGKSDVTSRDQSLFNIGTAEAGQRNLAAQDQAARRTFQLGQEQQADLSAQQAAARGVTLAGQVALGTATGNPAMIAQGFGQLGGQDSGLPAKSELSILKDLLGAGFTKKTGTSGVA